MWGRRWRIPSCRSWDTGQSSVGGWRGERKEGKNDLNSMFSSRYRVLLSDGQAMTSYCLLAARLNHIIHHLASFTIIKITDYFMTNVSFKKILVIQDVEVVTSGQLVRVKLGNPAKMGGDGKVVQPLPRARARGEVEEQRAGPDDVLQEALDQLADLEI